MRFKKIILPSILLLLGFIYYFSFEYVYNSATNNILNIQIENSKIQSKIVSNLLSEKLKSGYSESEVKSELQRSIENMSTESSFICMFDDTGKEICHPNKEEIGRTLAENISIIKSYSNQKAKENLKKAVINKTSVGGIIREKETNTEIIYLSPIKNTNWIIASHSNILKIKEILNNLKEKLSFIFILVWLSTSLLIYLFLQFINSSSLKKISELNRETGNKYFNEIKEMNDSITKSLTNKEVITERLLADKGNQLTPVYISNIAYIFTENKTTYIIEHNNEKSTINLTLDEIFRTMDSSLFYRASRQIIVSAKAIDKIVKHGNTQLKVITQPASLIEITISKAKLTDFKKWIGKN